MDITVFLQDFVPVVGFVAIGYVLARNLEVATSSLRTVLRYALFPALLFTLLVSRIEPVSFVMIAGIGIALTAAGLVLVRFAPAVLKPKVDASAAIPNVATFALPFMALGWMSVGMGTAAALFVGIALAAIVFDAGGKAPGALLREPWIYAVVAALGFHALSLPTEFASHVLSPLAMASVPILLIFLGASMFPLVGIKDANAWATVGVRLAGGIAVALIAIALVPMSREVKEALVIIAFAPPATTALAMAAPGRQQKDKERDASHRAAALGTLVALVAMVSLELFSW